MDKQNKSSSNSKIKIDYQGNIVYPGDVVFPVNDYYPEYSGYYPTSEDKHPEAAGKSVRCMRGTRSRFLVQTCFR
jgi:hypothetical protein